MTDDPPELRRGVGLNAGRVVVAFVLMMGVALLLMVRFTDAPASQATIERVEAATDEPLIVPVAGIARDALTDTWGQSRADGARAHQGIDIIAPEGTPVLAVAAGTVERLFDSSAGGHTLYIRSTDHRWSYYYAHLAGYADGIAAGRAVRGGETIGYVGDTGNAGTGNFHLHFGLSRMGEGDGWWQGEPVNPYPLLVGRAGRR